MPKKKRKMRGGQAQAPVNSGTPAVGGAPQGKSASGGDISFKISNAPDSLKKIHSNPNQVVALTTLFIILLLVPLSRYVTGTQGEVMHRFSISVIAFSLGACLIGYYLLTGEGNVDLIVNGYLGLAFVLGCYWIWLITRDGFQNKDEDDYQKFDSSNVY